ncbi:MAG TPA: MFS transporter [Acidimicrobiia bacterium]|nr:MFS transporter [Acidimicrobiia bacterium]
MGRWRQLAALLAANGASWTGSRISGIAVPWFVLTTTGSAVRTGVVVAAQMGPYVISQALSGPFIDRVGPRRVVMIADLVVATGVALIPLLHGLDVLTFPLLLVLLAFIGAADGPSNSAKGIFMPEVAANSRVPLERVTGLVGTVERTATVVGPAIAGVVVAAWGAATSLWITAGLELLGGLLVAVFLPRKERRRAEKGSYRRELREGAAFLKRDRLLMSMYGMITVTNLIDTAMFSVLIPVWAQETGHGPTAIGLLASSLSGAAIVSSLLASAYGDRIPRRPAYVLGFVLGGVPRFIILATAVPLGWIVAVHAFTGFAIGFLNPIIAAILFERVPEHLLGRVRTLGGSLAWAGIPFGGVIAGAAITAIGLSPAFLVFGLVHLLAVLVPSFRPEWSEMDRQAAAVDDAA